MTGVVRLVLAIAAGSATWALLWNLGTRAAVALWPEQLADVDTITHTPLLLLYLGYGTLLSMLAGFVAASLAGRRKRLAVWILAALHLALGIAAELSYRELMPVWYHVVYVALIVPATLCGGWLRIRRVAAGDRA